MTTSSQTTPIVEMSPELHQWRTANLSSEDKVDTSAQIAALFRGELVFVMPYARSEVTLLRCSRWYVKYKLLPAEYVEQKYGPPNRWGIKVYEYIPLSGYP